MIYCSQAGTIGFADRSLNLKISVRARHRLELNVSVNLQLCVSTIPRALRSSPDCLARFFYLFKARQEVAGEIQRSAGHYQAGNSHHLRQAAVRRSLAVAG